VLCGEEIHLIINFLIYLAILNMNQFIQKPTIIYAEDSKSISTIVKHRLISEGYNVIHFATGEKVVEEALKILPDIILLDNDMPVKDGLSILKELKAIA